MLRSILTSAAIVSMAALPQRSWADPGETAFNTYCSMCHQVRGQGVPGQFPRIADRADKIASTPEGRRYLCTLVLYGMAGQVTVDGTPLVGVMPPLGMLSDQSLADALNHVMQFSGKGKVRAFTAAEVKAQRRAAPLSAAEVHAIRDQLVTSGAIP